ncbi:MAG TPA: histidine kinase dimerization/phosphoacceptor domain -containing protein [Polyangiaceae bacterium]|jgi:PAS domain S-box-containing protein|nr:histidine kinase dimerization/phosphoacceptor domain -containing protein [Polyangiaceae bacterium]
MNTADDALDERVLVWMRRASRFVSTGVALLGAAIWLGWLLDALGAMRGVAAFTNMKANTALCFIALGSALSRLRLNRADYIRSALSVSIAIVAGSTLVEHLSGVDLGIDQLFFRDSASLVAPGRMAPITALLFLLFTFSMLRVDSAGSHWSTHAAPLVAALTALTSLCGYLYDAPSLYRVGSSTSIALPTTVGFLASGFAFFCARPEVGWTRIVASDTSAGVLLRRLLPIAVALPVTFGYLDLLAQDVGWFDAPFSRAVLVVSNVMTVCFALGLVGASQGRSDLARRRVERNVRARERELSITLDSIGDAVIATDARGQVTRVNPVAEHLTGLGFAEALGKPLSEVFSLRQQGALRSPLDQGDSNTVTAGRGMAHHAELISRNGSVHPIAHSSAPIRALGSDVSEGTVVVFRDVSAEQLEVREQQFLHSLSETLRSHHVWHELVTEVATLTGRFLSVKRCAFVEVDAASGVARVQAGYSNGVETMTGTHRLSAFSPETQAEFSAGRTVVIADVSTDVRTANYYQQVYAKIGTRAVVAVPLQRDGRWVGLLTASTDVARNWNEREVGLMRLVAERTWLWGEHLRILDALRASEARKTAQLDSAFDGILSLDAAGLISEFNPSAERLFQRPKRDVIGLHVSELFAPPYFRQEGERDLATYLTKADSPTLGKSSELLARRADGSEFAAEVAITSVVDQVPALFVAFVRDISERKQLETQRAILLEQQTAAKLELEVRVAERTRDLQTTLREREILLQEIHHRVKNNLQVISSLINMQYRQLTDSGSRVALQECQRRVAAIALIHEKLYQSKDYGKVPFSDYATSLAQSIFHTAGVMRDDVTLSFDMQTTWLAVDRAIPCGLILNELITNALKHAFPKQRGGDIRLALSKDEAQRVTLEVADDGIGLPEDLDPERSTSLGMQLISVLVQQLEGDLRVTSKRGTSVRVVFTDTSPR